MHALAHAFGKRDFMAIMQFVIISLIVLPVLPNRAFDPFGVLNPFSIWLMVVLIVGISLAGYVIYKFAGQRAGTILAGLLGGLISSTATTASYARRSRATPGSRGFAVHVIVIASSVVFIRVLVLMAVAGPSVFVALAPPMAAMAAVFAVLAFVSSWFGLKFAQRMPEQKNPTELGGAILFGVLYAVVLLAVAFARERLGIRGIYAVAVLSGLTDMDAITLSVTSLAHEGKLAVGEAWRAVLAASLSNIAFKAGIAAVLGGLHLFLRVAIFFAIAAIAGALLLIYWPA
jgi:uncharacterized membrane protein (DUF4010 family)